MQDDDSGLQSGYATADDALLALRTSHPRERADAARNRAAVLEAAASLFARHGVESVSMDAIAAEAGVGKGTLFRRFGDRAGLAAALLDKRERALQERILFGEAPLGPGIRPKTVTPRDRLLAFVGAYLDYALAHLDLVRMSETAAIGARYRIGAYRFWHRHTAMLLAADSPDSDAEVMAHVVLAPLAAEHLHAVARESGPQRVQAAIEAMIMAVLDRASRSPDSIDDRV